MRDNRHLAAKHLLHGRRVAITGGGPAGLTLARLLQMRGVAVTVFERDPSPDARGQGGSLDLHEDSGQRALAAAGLSAAFLSHARADGQHTRVFDKQGKVRADMRAEDEAQSRPEIDRGAIRDLLLASLEPGTVQWSRRLTDVRRSVEGVELVFGDDAITADVVFGCDGGWSKVRPLVSDLHEPEYSGVVFVQSFISDVDRRHPDISALVGPGNILVLGERRGLLAQRNGDGTVRVYSALTVPKDWATTSGIDFGDARAVRERLRALFADWDPRITALLTVSDDSFVPWPLYVYPARQSWTPRNDATLLGDAAHIMPPFTGRGANYAMLDALELADALTEDAHSSLAAALEGYERQMLARMEPAIKETMASQHMLLAADAPHGLAAMIAAEQDAASN